VIWLLGLGVIAVGSVLVFGTAVAMTRSDPDRSSISLPIGLYTGIALVAVSLIVLTVLIWRLIVEIEAI
jgi:hypothetical protein